MIKSFKDLDVWKNGVELVSEIYLISKRFPREEMYGLINQMRRAAVSIPSNIAEGFLRKSTNEFIQFLYIALGSCGELDTQLAVTKNLNYVDEKIYEQVSEKINHISRMLRALINSLRGRNNETRNTNHEARH